jgi:cytochrome b pre-mRNA-processing protein 3
MIFRLFRRPSEKVSIAALYGMIVAQARNEAFYRGYGVPDTVDGRIEMLILHAVLVLQRLEGGPEQARLLGQSVFDEFCRDMDANLREMGVGDLALPRKMHELGEAFYGRQRAYRAALTTTDERLLAQTLLRNVFAGRSAPAGHDRLAAYVRDTVRGLAKQESFGAIEFPDPERIELPA